VTRSVRTAPQCRVAAPLCRAVPQTSVASSDPHASRESPAPSLYRTVYLVILMRRPSRSRRTTLTHSTHGVRRFGILATPTLPAPPATYTEARLAASQLSDPYVYEPPMRSRAVGGRSGAQRTNFAALLEGARSGRSTVLLLARHDRLARNGEDWRTVAAALTHARAASRGRAR
jgi:hypothetical protein